MRLAAVAKDVSDVERYRGRARIDGHLLGAVKLLASCYLDAVPDESPVLLSDAVTWGSELAPDTFVKAVRTELPICVAENLF